MMTDLLSSLVLLQHSDSFFPSGGVAFSYGLETLCDDGLVSGDHDVSAFLHEQLLGRWATVDRGVLVAAFEAAGDIEQVARIDRLGEAVTLARELRVGSRRAGAALLSVHVRLGTEGARSYSERVYSGNAIGHVAVVQGIVWRGVGLDVEQCCIASAHVQCVGILGAAIRLGVIGHVASQQILADVRSKIAHVLRTPAPALSDLYAYTPVSEVAVMRHESQSRRLFSN